MTDCELPEFYQHSDPVARREHICCECRAAILKGEKHFHARGKWDGEVSSYRQHLLCCEACMLIRDELNSGDCIGFGTLFEQFSEMCSEDQWFQDSNRYREPWRRLRSLMAKIMWRARQKRRREGNVG